MAVTPDGLAVVVTMFFIFDFNRNESHLAMAHSTLGDHTARKFFHGRTVAAQNGHFQTAVMIKVNMHRGDRKIVVPMIGFSEPLRYLSNSVIINIMQACN